MIERLNREVERRTVLGIFPSTDALLRLSACVLIEAHDEWQDSDRRYLSEEPMALLNPPAPTALEPRREEPNEVMDQPADGIVTITAKQHARTYTHLGPELRRCQPDCLWRSSMPVQQIHAVPDEAAGWPY